MEDHRLPVKRRERQLTRAIEAAESEFGSLGPFASIRRGSEIAASVGQQRPRQQDEEQRHEANGDALGDELGAPTQGH